jgi:hypothetical protein
MPDKWSYFTSVKSFKDKPDCGKMGISLIFKQLVGYPLGSAKSMTNTYKPGRDKHEISQENN